MADEKTAVSLIVEDDPAAQMIFRSFLKGVKSDVIIANNGAEGLYHLVTKPEIDFIILDMMMPRLDGEQFLEATEALLDAGMISLEPKVIICTALTQFSLLKQLVNYRLVHSVRQKPIDKDTLIRDFNEIVSSSQ